MILSFILFIYNYWTFVITNSSFIKWSSFFNIWCFFGIRSSVYYFIFDWFYFCTFFFRLFWSFCFNFTLGWKWFVIFNSIFIRDKFLFFKNCSEESKSVRPNLLFLLTPFFLRTSSQIIFLWPFSLLVSTSLTVSIAPFFPTWHQSTLYFLSNLITRNAIFYG